MRKFGFVIALILVVPAWAGIRAYNGTTDLKIFDQIKCSTGLTCTREGSKLLMVSSPTITTSTLTIAGIEGGDAGVLLNADEGDDNADKWEILSEASGDALNFLNKTSGSYVSKFKVSTGGNLTVVGSVTGDGGDAMSGFLQKQVAATATTITAAQCGSTFINTGAVAINLPEASTVLGCRLTFITGNASNFDVNPDDADQILVETNAAGDSMRNATLGNSITVEAISASQWAPVAVSGTWSDIN